MTSVKQRNYLAELEAQLAEEPRVREKQRLPDLTGQKEGVHEKLLKMKLSPEDLDIMNTPLYLNDSGYAFTRVRKGKKNVTIHRIVLRRKLGRELTKLEECDHLNGDHLDKRRENLRSVTHEENQRNRHARLSNTGYIGVHYEKDQNRYRAYMSINVVGERRQVLRKSFKTAKEAALAYNECAEKWGVRSRNVINPA